MRPVRSLNKIPWYALGLIVMAGLAAGLALPAPGRGRRARSVDAARPRGVPRPVAPRPKLGPLLLSSFSVGPEPSVFRPGQRIVSTFITDDGESCHVVAAARLAGDASAVIHWSVVAPFGFTLPGDRNWTGPRLDVVLRRPGGNSRGLGGPLSLAVQAWTQVDGEVYTAGETVVQDELDQLRQEYIDLARDRIPDRAEFIDAATFAARYGHRYPWLRFEDLNWSVNGSTQRRYSYAIIRPNLVEGLDQVRRAYGGLLINSGYRNPVHQVEVNAPVRESLHQYGYAADLAVVPGGGRGLPNEGDWRRLAEAACSAGARWIEPLASSAPNSPGCHVHMDYRPGPASSAPVHLHGQVIEAATGRPVAGALVLLGAMPARTDAGGIFGIRNVLSGGSYPVEVHADGFETLKQPVDLVAWGSAFVRLALHRAMHPAFTVEVARAHWVDRKTRLVAATLRVSNTGAGDVRDVRLSVEAGRALLISQEPPAFESLPASAVRGVAVVLRLNPVRTAAAVPVSVAVTYHGTSRAKERAQVALSILPPGALPPAGGLRIVKKPGAAPTLAPHTLERAQPAPAQPVPAAQEAAPQPAAAPSRIPEGPMPGQRSGSPSDPKPAPASPPPTPEPVKSPAPVGRSPEAGPPAANNAGSAEPQQVKPDAPPPAAPAAPGDSPKSAAPGETK